MENNLIDFNEKKLVWVEEIWPFVFCSFLIYCETIVKLLWGHMYKR